MRMNFFKVQWTSADPVSHLLHGRQEGQGGGREIRKALRKNTSHIYLALSSRELVNDKAGIETTLDQQIERTERLSGEGTEEPLAGKLQISRFKVCIKQQLCRENVQLPGPAWEKWQSGGRQRPSTVFLCWAGAKQRGSRVPAHRHPEVMDGPIRFQLCCWEVRVLRRFVMWRWSTRICAVSVS